MSNRNIALVLEKNYLNAYDLSVFQRVCQESNVQTGQWTMGNTEPLTSNNVDKYDYFIILNVNEKDFEFIQGLFAGRTQEKPKLFIIGILG
jgi:hypothetical protein